MFSRQYARVLQGFFRVDGVFRAPALSPLTSRAAPTGIGIVQRALRPELLPGMMPPVRLDGSHRSGSTASVQRAITRPGGPLARLRAYPSRPASGPLLRAAAPRAPADDVHATWVETARLFTSGTGQPLASAICRSMEAMFDTDFSAVRVHHGPAARALGALAFTSGDDIYFAPGQYAPHSRHGLELLGHELAHVVQQRAGHVVNPFGHGIAVVQDPRLEHEADAMARLIGTRMWHWRSASGSQASAGERAERARRPGRGRGQGAAQLMEDRGSDRRSIDIELTPPPKDKDKDKITITMQLTEEILKEAGDPRKTELFKRRLAKALAQASPDCLPAVTKLAGLARDVRVLIQKMTMRSAQ